MAYPLDDGWWVEADGDSLSLRGYPSEFRFREQPLPEGVVAHPRMAPVVRPDAIEIRIPREAAPREWLAFVLAHRTAPVWLCCETRAGGRLVSRSRMPGWIQGPHLAVFDINSAATEQLS
jgi:hypothetical protein